jgi:hypothetical protein
MGTSILLKVPNVFRECRKIPFVEDNNKEWLDFISGMKSGGQKID